MNSATEPTLARGVLLFLDRDQAKQLFAARQPEPLREFLVSLIENSEQRQTARVIDLANLWQSIQETLVHPDVVADEMDRQGLAFCLLGGRPLPGEPALVARLVRPDIVPQLSATLASVDQDRLAAHWNDAATLPQATRVFHAVCQLYETAAAAKAAVVFAAEQP